MWINPLLKIVPSRGSVAADLTVQTGSSSEKQVRSEFVVSWRRRNETRQSSLFASYLQKVLALSCVSLHPSHSKSNWEQGKFNWW